MSSILGLLSFVWLVKAILRGPRGFGTYLMRKSLYGAVRRVR